MTGPAVHSRGHAHITRTCIFALLTKARCGDSTAILGSFRFEYENEYEYEFTRVLTLRMRSSP